MSESQTAHEYRQEVLPDDSTTMCCRCGTEYVPDWDAAPENASFYWEPSCPHCGAKMTANPADEDWLNIISWHLDEDGGDEEEYEQAHQRLHAHARLVHGRLVDVSVADLVRKARWFDRNAQHGTAYGPRWYRSIAFALRKQARETVLNE